MLAYCLIQSHLAIASCIALSYITHPNSIYTAILNTKPIQKGCIKNIVYLEVL